MKAGMKKFMAAAVLMMALVITAGFGATKAMASVSVTAKQTSKTTNSISVQWSTSVTNGETLKGYQIDIREYNGSGEYRTVANLTSGSSMYTINNLKAGTKYYVKVIANYRSRYGGDNSTYSNAYEDGKYFASTALTTVTGLKQVKWWYFALSLDVAWNKQEAADGYEVELVSGITSFCAAAARLGVPLMEWDEPLHIVPAVHKTKDDLSLDGNYVLMKSASHMKEVKELLIKSGRKVDAVENCGMDTEKIYRSAEEIPDDAGYFSLIIAK